jgi:hypothetical protein
VFKGGLQTQLTAKESNLTFTDVALPDSNVQVAKIKVWM